MPDRALRARLRSSGALRSGAAQRRASTARVKAPSVCGPDVEVPFMADVEHVTSDINVIGRV